MRLFPYCLILTLMFCATLIRAQEKSIDMESMVISEFTVTSYTNEKSLDKQLLVIDTILPDALGMPCNESAFLYNLAGVGFIGGTNIFMDFEKAQRFRYDEADCYGITQAVIFFGRADAVGDGQVTVKVYSVDPMTNGPGELLGTSNPLNTSALNTDTALIVPTLFTFDNPPKVNGNEFFVSVDLSQVYAAQDSVGILMTPINCGDGADAWELFGDGQTWVALEDTVVSWGLESNFFMAVVLDTDQTTSIDEVTLEENGFESFRIFPNPARVNTKLEYHLLNNSRVVLELFTLDGKQIDRRVLGQRPAGHHIEPLDTSGFPSGKYVVSVQTDQGRISTFLDIKH